MESFKDLLKSQGKKIEIADDIEALEALATIRVHWEKLRGAVPAAELDGVLAFIESLIQGSASGPLVEALNALDLPGDKLRAALAKLGDTFERVDRKYVALLRPVAAFDEDAEHTDVGLLDWPLLGLTKTGAAAGSAKKRTYAFDLGAAAKLELEAGDTWPGAETAVADPLLRIGLGGSFELDAKARVPFSGGALGLGVEASREAFLDYYFDARADDDLFAAAVARRLGGLPNPLRLDSVWEAFAGSDIAGAVLEMQGQSQFSVDVALADAFAFKHDIKMDVGLTFKAKVRRRNTFMLRLRKIANEGDGSMSVEATIERLEAKSGERAAELGVDVDLSSLGKRLAKMLEKHEGKLQALLEDYGDYLEPGTYLREAALKSLRKEFIEGLTEDAKLEAALEDVAARALGFDGGDADGLEKLLDDKIAALLDGADGVITGRIDEVAGRVAAALTAELGFAPSLLGTVTAKVRKLVEGLRADLEQRIKKQSAAKLDALIAKADAAGAKVAAAGSRADRALSGVRDAIGKYEQTIAKLKAAVSDAAQMKVTAKISAEKSRRQERAVDAKLVFLRPTESAKRIYGDVVRGDLDALVALMKTPSSDVAVVGSATTLSELEATSHRAGFAAVLVKFELAGSSIFDAKSEVVIEGGSVSVMSEGAFKSRKRKPHEEREVSFLDAYELSAAEETRELDVALEISHEDDKLKRREIEKVLRGFESAALLPPHTTRRAVETFERWVGPGDKKRIPADIKLALRLGPKHLERVMRLDRRDGSALPVAIRREIFDTVIEELVESGFHEKDHVARIARAVHEALGGREPMPPPNDLLFEYTPKVHRQLERTVFEQHEKMRLERASDLHTRCMSLVNVFDTMGDIYTAVPKIGSGDGWDARQYDAAQRQLNDDLEDWIKAGWRDEVRPRTIAFVGTLIALAKLDGEADTGFLALTMTKRGEGGETVVLTAA